jgi:hypothetical protein
MREKAERDRIRVVAMIEAAEAMDLDEADGKQVFSTPGLAQYAVLLGPTHITESAEREPLSASRNRMCGHIGRN